MTARHLNRPGLVATLTVTLVLMMITISALRLTVDNSPTIWLPEGDSEVAYYEQFKSRFGNDSVLGVVSEATDLKNPEKLRDLRSLAAQLEALPGVSKLRTPIDEKGGLKTDEMSETLISKDSRRIVTLLTLVDGLKPNEVLSLLDQLEETSQAFGDFSLVGTEIVTRDLNKGSEQSFGGLFPLVALALSAVVYWSLGSARMVLAILAAATVSAIVSVGTMACFGASMNLLVVLMPAVLVVLTVAASIHLCSRCRDLAENLPQESQTERNILWSKVITDTWKPCSLATLTTSLGFASLTVSEVGPVSDLGFFTALGSIWVLLWVFVLVPLIVSRRAITPRVKTQNLRLERYVSWLGRHRIKILVSGLGLFLAAASGISHLRVESNIMEFFSKEHPLPQAYRDYEANFFGLTSFEVVIEGPLSKIVDLQTLQALDELESDALASKIIDEAHSPWLSNKERSPQTTSMTLKGLFQDIPQEARDYMWRAGGMASIRATFTAPTGSSNQAFESVEKLRHKIRTLQIPRGVWIRISGAAPLLVRGQVLLLNTQIRSFALALTLITLVIILGYRSLRLSILSLVCNVLPIAGTLGMMGWFSVPLNAGTVTVAGIALGLIVDDTIHLIHGFSKANGQDAKVRAMETLRLAGRPVLITSVAVAIGFGLFSLTSFQPTKFFGILTALTSLFAVVADLVLLPALLTKD